MYIIFLAVSFIASIAGAICGIGGGVITKPVLDATGVMGVSEISFLSSCTVLVMSAISVYKSVRRKSLPSLKTTTPLAIGAAIGGILGKQLFELIYNAFQNKSTVGMIQSALFFITTLGTLCYHLNEKRIKTYQFQSILLCISIGLSLGLISSFLGVGGGPINIVVLAFFFSFGMKEAASGSLYVILFSQSASLIISIITKSIPNIDVTYLVLMLAGGIAGGLLGNKINGKIEENKVKQLFLVLMIIVILISVYNFIKFSLT